MERTIIQPNQKLKIHPAAQLMPMMTPEELTQLKIDIQEKGQKEPVVLYKGLLLDGRNRLKACQELNIPVNAVSLPEEEDPYFHVTSLNLHRRHLSTSQKAAIAAKIMNQLEPEPGQKRRDIAAEAFGVSPKLVQGAKKLLEENPKVFEDVFKGECTIHKALRKTLEPKTSPAIRIIQDLLALIPGEKRQELEKIQEETSPVYAPIVGERIREIAQKPLEEHIAKFVTPSTSSEVSDNVPDLGIKEPEFGF